MKTKLVLLISILAIIVFAGNYVSRQHFIQKGAGVKTASADHSINYENAWIKIDSMIGVGLSQSALAEVMKIYIAAKAENNAPQFVKAIMYKMKLQNNYQEDSYENSIKDLKSEITTAAFPIKPILHSVLAEMYWRYYSINRWKWSQRTETVNFKEDDMQTWDLKKLVKEVIYNYVMSLKDVDNLKKTNLGIYDNILVKDTSTRNLRPTL